MYTASDRGNEIFKIIETMNQYKIKITKELILDITKIVYGYTDTVSIFENVSPLIETILKPKEETEVV